MSTIMTIGKRVNPKMRYDEKKIKRMTSFTVYAQIHDLNDLADAIYLDNREFFYVDLDVRYNGVIDIMVIDISGERFEMVTRKMNPDGVNYIDTTCVIDVSTFTALKDTSSIGYKHKYLQFQIPGTEHVWEVSVFMGNDGQDHPWVRCELFTDDISVISELPFKVDQFTVEGDDQNPVEAIQHIDNLWQREYSRIDRSDVIKS